MTTGSIFWFVLFACIGGVIVLVGLLMEALSEKRWFNSIAEFRRWESAKYRGEWIVIFGIVAEIVVAGWFAKDEWQNNPLHRPISDIAALAVIEIKGSGQEITPKIEPFMDALIVLRDSTNPVSSHVEMLISDGFRKYFAFTTERGNNAQYSLRFHLDATGLNRINKEARAIKNIKFLGINAFFLPTNSEVTWGHVTLIANSEIQKTFTILPQNHPSLGFGGMPGIMIFATNSTPEKVVPNLNN
jgi:hypothetical protein